MTVKVMYRMPDGAGEWENQRMNRYHLGEKGELRVWRKVLNDGEATEDATFAPGSWISVELDGRSE